MFVYIGIVFFFSMSQVLRINFDLKRFSGLFSYHNSSKKKKKKKKKILLWRRKLCNREKIMLEKKLDSYLYEQEKPQK